jgi:hypothetical protein
MVLDGQINRHINKAFFGRELDNQGKDLETIGAWGQALAMRGVETAGST